ncbi:MAG: FHA domain-containing protein [Deltaproteobacteria bacterium]|nr:FHA domain-containing protein [Deltaproteobacteria bacterium]
MQIRPLITVKDRSGGQKGRYKMDQDHILIGRDRSCFVLLESRTVSRRHAEILRDGDQFFLKDLKSGNRTLLNEVPLEPEEKTLLHNGDLIRVGQYDLRFALPSSTEDDIYEKTDSDIIEIKMVKKLLKALDRENAPSLEVVEGPGAGKRFILEGKSQEIIVGRDPSCEFRIDSDVISRKHARLIRKWDAVQIEDLGSRNGIYVGKKRIRRTVLRDGDRVHLGTIVLMFRNPQEVAVELSPPEIPAKEEKKEKPKEEKRPKPEATPETPVEMPIKKRGWAISASEILIALIGLVILSIAIWGIFKIL